MKKYTVELTEEQCKQLGLPVEPMVPKWEPKAGMWYVTLHGTVNSSTKTVRECTKFGIDRNTKAEAEEAAKAMRTHNRLLAYAAEFDKGWKPDWNDFRQSKYSIYFDNENAMYRYSYNIYSNSIGIVYMSKECAKGLVEKLNNGEVVL